MDTTTTIILAVVGVYVGLSVLFFTNPEMLYGFQPNVLRKNVIASNHLNIVTLAHRLGCKEGYESTVQAAEAAIDNGAQVLDLDLVITKDGVPVMSHDLTLGRIAG